MAQLATLEEMDGVKFKVMFIQSKVNGKWGYSLMHPAMILNLEYDEDAQFNTLEEAQIAATLDGLDFSIAEHYVKKS